MRKITAFIVGLGLSACGPAWSGKVSGYSLETKETLFTQLTDRNGAALAGLIIVSDQSDTCALLAASKAPSNATLAVFALMRRADNNWLSPDVGDYVVTNGPASTSASTNAIFMRTDANGTNSVPVSNRVTTSGKLDVTQWSVAQGAASAQFEGKFGAQNDAVHASLSASWCAISTESLANGFIGRDFGLLVPGSSTTQRPVQSAQCADMLACYRATYGNSSTASLDSSYGPTGTCWGASATQATADSCTTACTQALVSVRQQSNASSICFQ